MAKIDSTLLDFGTLDTLACRDTPIHRLDPRAKLVTTLVFIVAVASFDRYAISSLLPFFIFPAVMIAMGNLPLGYLVKKLLVVSPFAFGIGVLNPLFDQTPLLSLGPLTLTGGWVSFLSILLRFTLTVGAALVLIATSGFPGVCRALERLGMPKVFVVQLLLLYRYLFVLVGEGTRMVRARALRSFGRRGRGLTVFGHMVGQLLMRTLDRAQRIHLAMLCRGFEGDVRLLHPLRIGRKDILFTLGWSGLFILFRLVGLPHLIGALIMEVLT